MLDIYERERLKKKVLILASHSSIPVTPNYASEKLNINYQTAMAMLYELALEGHLKMRMKGLARYFIPVRPDELVMVTKEERKLYR